MTKKPALLEWFGSLTQPEMLELVRDVLDQFEEMDPGAAARMEMWKRRETARFITDLVRPEESTIRGIGFHLSVEDGERALWRSVMARAEDGRLQFRQAETTGLAGGSSASWIAPLGIGTLVVYEDRDHNALVFKASKRKSLSVHDCMRPGATIPSDVPIEEGFTILLVEGVVTIVGSLNDLRPKQISAARSAAVRIGLAKATDGLIVLGLNIHGLTDGWEGIPFSLAIEPPENRHIMPPDIGGERSLMLVLADRATSKVAVMRTLRVSSKWSAEFERILEFQEDVSGSYDQSDYIRDHKASRQRWPNPNDIEKDFTAVDVVLSIASA